MSRSYGASPQVFIRHLDLEWDEYMHYMYMPVYMTSASLGPVVRLPRRLEFLRRLLTTALINEPEYEYMYVTARRGFATPDNPLNRPGWHTDGFGSDDVNFVWTDRYPTRFAVQRFTGISADHVESIKQFEEQVDDTCVVEFAARTVLKLDPYVVHQTPNIPFPGGERSFLKITLSNSRFNLLGNSHNYLFDYDWRMWARQEVRNHPTYAGGDAGPQEAEVPSS